MPGRALGRSVGRLRIVVLGAAGRLGAALAREYSRDHDVMAWGRSEADLGEPGAVGERVRASGADLIINTAAMTNVDVCEEQRDLAQRVNADAPARIAEAAEATGARCIHISTDYVFSGSAERPYEEEDQPGPLSWYGATKLAGEQGVLAAGGRHAVVRVAWVFGPDRDCFVDKALHMALRGDAVAAVADKFSSPTYTLDAAAALRGLFGTAVPGGIYHLCQRGVCSWQQWAQEAINAALDLGVPVRTREVAPMRLADLKLMTAPRPVNTAMSCARLEAVNGQPMRPWPVAVRDYVRLLRDAGRLITA